MPKTSRKPLIQSVSVAQVNDDPLNRISRRKLLQAHQEADPTAVYAFQLMSWGNRERSPILPKLRTRVQDMVLGLEGAEPENAMTWVFYPEPGMTNVQPQWIAMEPPIVAAQILLEALYHRMAAEMEGFP